MDASPDPDLNKHGVKKKKKKHAGRSDSRD